MRNVKIIAGNANRSLAESVANIMNARIVKADIEKFPNGETRVQINESVRKADIFIIQSTCPPVNDNLMELLIIIDALKRASAGFITVIMPYFGYAKQDKKKSGREPITAKLVAKMLEAVKVGRIVTFDLHAPQIEGFFDITVENLTALNMIAKHFKKKRNFKNTVVVAPDAGGVKRARDLANAMKARRIAIIDKHRDDYRSSKAMNVVGKVEGMEAIIIDDFIDTGGSMVAAINALKDHRAKNIYVCATHPLLTDPATDRFKSIKGVKEFVFTDTLPIESGKILKNYTILSTAPSIAKVITKLVGGGSLKSFR